MELTVSCSSLNSVFFLSSSWLDPHRSRNECQLEAIADHRTNISDIFEMALFHQLFVYIQELRGSPRCLPSSTLVLTSLLLRPNHMECSHPFDRYPISGIIFMNAIILFIFIY